MPIVFRIFLLLVTLVIAMAALLFLLPSLKEGFGIEELPQFLGMTAALLVVAWLWWRARHVTVRAIGLAIIALPLLLYTLLDAKVVFNVWYGWHLARESKITAFQSTPVIWAGFDGPVGVHLELDLEHPVVSEVNLFAPNIGPLTAPLFPLRADKRNVFQHGGVVHLSYDLYASTLCRVESPRMVCFWKWRQEPSASAVSWQFVTSGGAYADMSQALSERVRGDGKEWTAIVKRTQPEGLIRAGFQLCAGSVNKDTSQDCYCR